MTQTKTERFHLLVDHPLLKTRREAFAPMTDDDCLRVHIHHLLHLDPAAVYYNPDNSDSTIIYYESATFGLPVPPGGSCRIVFDPAGRRRDIRTVGYRPKPSS